MISPISLPRVALGFFVETQLDVVDMCQDISYIYIMFLNMIMYIYIPWEPTFPSFLGVMSYFTHILGV